MSRFPRLSLCPKIKKNWFTRSNVIVQKLLSMDKNSNDNSAIPYYNLIFFSHIKILYIIPWSPKLKTLNMVITYFSPTNRKKTCYSLMGKLEPWHKCYYGIPFKSSQGLDYILLSIQNYPMFITEIGPITQLA